MKAKALLTAVLLAATNFAYATGGGLSVDNDQHMNANSWVETQAERPVITTYGSLEKFEVETARTVVDTEKFKNSNNGQV